MFIRSIILGIFVLSFSSFFLESTFAECPNSKKVEDDKISAIDYLRDCADGTDGINPDMGNGGTAGVKDLVIKVAEVALRFAALFAVGAIVFSGVRYTTAYGDDEKVKKAKTTAIFALIGLVLTLTAFPLVNILVNFIYGLPVG